MRILDCDPRHLEAIRAIFNEAIVKTTALYEYQPRSAETVAAWYAAKRAAGLPLLVAEDDDGRLLGFATYGPFRAFPAYKFTVEHSVYVDFRQRGRGIGRQLLAALIEAAQAQGCHCLVGVIDAQNAGSIALHEKLGFTHGGGLRQAGFKFGRWLDLVFYQLLLPTPAEPVDG
jgi:L-amino acid N-acyltransferase YncA